MKKLRLLSRVLEFFQYSPAFDDLTYRVGALLLLMPCMIGIPIGLHRPWLGLMGWWIFSCLFVMSVIGAVLFLHYGHAWAMLCVPYPLAILHDVLLIATIRLPQSATEND